MIYDTGIPDNPLRIFLDIPYRLGGRHLQIACSSEKRISEIAQTVTSPKTEIKPLSLKSRIVHFVIGLSECIPVIGIFVALIDRYLHREQSLDVSNLIKGRQSINPHHNAFFLNMALLKSAYNSSAGSQKERVKFLAANFLNKVSPKKLDLSANKLQNIDPDYLAKHQGSPLEEFRYHREILEQKLDFGKKFNQKLAYGNKSLFILTDTSEVQHLFPLKFTVIDEKTPKERYASLIAKMLKEHLAHNPEEALKHPLQFPFLLDVTHLLDASIQTDGSNKLQKAFSVSFDTFRGEFQNACEQAIEEAVRENPLFKPHKERLKKYLNHSITCISRVDVEGASGIKMLPFDGSQTKDAQFHSPLIDFVIHTGIYIGAIGLRKLTADLFLQRPDIAYSVSGKEIFGTNLYYKSKDDFTKGPLFQRLLCCFGSKAPPSDSSCGIAQDLLIERIQASAKKPHFTVLGKATVDLIHGVMNEITTEMWEEIHKDPVFSDIFQTNLFVLKERLAAAEHALIQDNFNTFSQEIELAHAHLAIVLELTKPFNEADFAQIYRKELLGNTVSSNLQNLLKVGLGKTAVNIFAGITQAAKQSNPEFHGVCSQGSYFEQAIFMDQYYDHIIKDRTWAKVGLYLGQFNPNIEVGVSLTDYVRRDIAADVKKLLAEDKVTENFTVAVDITIDKYHSDNVKKLLEQFEDEIKAGKLNFVFFSSGQKFATLGMDDYYGAYFYMLNDGSDKWKAFESLLTHPVYRTDTLSTQWFCLSHLYAPDSLSRYRKLIFDNTRDILDQMPASLLPGAVKNQKVRINRASPHMDACFIDIKVMGSPTEQEARCREIEEMYQRVMLQHGIKTYGRGSFGFVHQNFAVFGPIDPAARVIRLNPGINPLETPATLEFMRLLAERAPTL